MRRLAPVAFLLIIACSATLYVRQVSDTLYFGTEKPDHTVVTDAEWQQFLHDVVTPRFPGFTHWEAHGSWKNKAEETHVLVIIHPNGGSAAIAQIIDQYKRRFSQEAVFQVRSVVSLPVK
ncbi:MAG: DUF3574 domain-containing protein [Acidobacteriota bacterium]|nr:DUF3574 domain-containing protein [Acidobacteriota bacterium]